MRQAVAAYFFQAIGDPTGPSELAQKKGKILILNRAPQKI